MADFISSLLNKTPLEQQYPADPIQPNLSDPDTQPLPVVDPDLQAKRDLYNEHANIRYGNVSGFNALFGPNGEAPDKLDPDLWNRTSKMYDERKVTEDKHKEEDAAEAKRLAEKLNAARKSAGLSELPVPAGPIGERGMAETLKERHGDDVPKTADVATTPLAKLNDTEDDEAPLSLGNLQQMKASNAQSPTDYMSALLAAQAQSKNLAGLQMMGKGAERFGAALARVPHDKDYLNEMTPQINQPVTDVINQQKMADMGLDYQMKQRNVASQQDMDNPNSDVSQLARQIIKRGSPDLKTENLTATQMTQLLPGLKTILETEYNREAKLSAVKAKTDAATSDKQDKAYTDLRKNVETFRGNQAAQQAAKDVLSVNKAMDMINMGDPNKLTTQDLRLLTSELAKVASGGVPTEHGTTDLMPNNLKTKFAELKNFLASNPTDANAAAYVQKNKKYLQAMQKTSQDVLDNFRKNIAAGYKNRVKSDDWDQFQSDYHFDGSSKENTPAKTDLVKVINPKGVPVNIDRKELQEALSSGYKVAE